jgi:hypothetical protein
MVGEEGRNIEEERERGRERKGERKGERKRERKREEDFINEGVGRGQ